MSKLAGEMRSTSGKAVAAYEGFSWPCFWLGPFWFAFKGMWVFAIAGGVVVLAIPYGYLITQLGVPFFANALYRYHLSKRGYSRHNSVTPSASPWVPLHLRRKDKQLRGQKQSGVQVAASESPGEVAKRGAKPRGKLKSVAARSKSVGGVVAKRNTARWGTGVDKGAKAAKGKRVTAKVRDTDPVADRIDGKAGIQAIVDTSRGDCVVHPGEYVGPLRIRRSVEIDFRNSTLHARKGPVLVIDAPRVCVRNVTIEVTGSSDELCVEEAVAVKVVRSSKLRFENVTLFGSLQGFADEEGVWEIPRNWILVCCGLAWVMRFQSKCEHPYGAWLCQTVTQCWCRRQALVLVVTSFGCVFRQSWRGDFCAATSGSKQIWHGEKWRSAGRSLRTLRSALAGTVRMANCYGIAGCLHLKERREG